jgi:flavin reductase (DIM6/NTAB) family NADH-FMN oxidoreductase RutF
MQRKTVSFDAYLKETLRLLANPGLLLLSQGLDRESNAMTIACGQMGNMWGMKVFTILVRTSRYTFSRLEESDSFTINVPSPGLYDAVTFCGRHSGRDCDKLAACDLTLEASEAITTPGIAECPVIYECKILDIDALKGGLDPNRVGRSFPGEELFRPYYGEILAVRAVEEAREMLEPARGRV